MWRPQPADLQRVFEEQNPWHGRGEVPASLAHRVERPLARLLWRRLTRRPPRFQLILGPRRVGKSTTLYQTVRHLIAADDGAVGADSVWWLRLDHPVLLGESLGDLVRAVVDTCGATKAKPAYLMLDELVYAADWDLWLKTFFDDGWPVRIAATSSATAALRGRRLESGVGRWSEQHLTPYLLSEHLDLAGVRADVEVHADLATTIEALPARRRSPKAISDARRTLMLVGGFPELLLEDRPDAHESDRLLRSQAVLRSDAIERAVYKDIPQSFGVDNPLMLERLLYVLAAQMTGVLSPSGICKDLGLSQPTFDRYLAYLEQAFLVFTLPNYSGREGSVQRRGRKLYFVDGAVRNAALQRGLSPLDNPTELGALVENLVAATLRSLALHTGVRLYHWREGRHEVDILVDAPDRPLAFEVGLSADHARRGLAALMERHPRFRGGCYVLAPGASVVRPDATVDGVGTVPLDLFLALAGAQAERALGTSLA